VKDAIQAKKVAYMALQQSRLFFAFAVRRGEKVPSTHGEKVQNAILGDFGHKLDSD